MHQAMYILHVCVSSTGRSPAKSTFCGVAHSGVKTSGSRLSAIGKKLKMPPPALLISTTVTAGCSSPAYHNLFDQHGLLPLVTENSQQTYCSQLQGKAPLSSVSTTVHQFTWADKPTATCAIPSTLQTCMTEAS